jgi:hypothetical protein
MKVKFLKDTTVEVMEPSTGTNDVYDELIRAKTVVEVDDIIPVSSNFVHFYIGETVWINIRKDLFTREV